MAVTTQPVVGTVPAATGALAPERKKVSWGAIFAGTVVGLAITVALGLLGAGIGLHAVDPGGETETFSGISITAAIYFVVCQLIALAIGGYTAARMSATWDSQNAMLHGATVWGVTTLAALYLATSAAGSLYNTTVGAISSATSAAGSAISAIAPDDLPSFSLPDLEMADLPQPIREALQSQGLTPDRFQRETTEAFNSVVSASERERAATIVTNAARDAILAPSSAMTELETATNQLVGEGGVISGEDRAELVTAMETRFGVTPAEAEEVIAGYEAKAKATIADAGQAVQDARTQAVEATTQATDAAGTAAFWAFVASMLGLAAAVAGAGAGRREHPFES